MIIGKRLASFGTRNKNLCRNLSAGLAEEELLS